MAVRTGGTQNTLQISRLKTDFAVIGRVEPGADGDYTCHHFGSNVDPLSFSTLDDVADFLRAHPRSGVRMYPSRKKISRNIHIDGIFLR
ncbi:hypothetical protein AGR1C_pAt20163 [Agrobacterium fabacearum TT111]|nr:hypothetical protein AGR1C_pAt20163 [Agrobacterium fabacearum TT111]